MNRTIELKHVKSKEPVHTLIDTLIDRLEEKLRHFPTDAVSLHVLFEENASRRLYRTALTCHVPRHMIVTHEERRDPGASLREAFEEVERQLVKRYAMMRKNHRRRPTRRSTEAET